MSKLTLMDALEHIIDGETIAVFAKLEVGTKECFNTEIERAKKRRLAGRVCGMA